MITKAIKAIFVTGILASMLIPGQVWSSSGSGHPDSSNWNDLFKQDLSNAIYPDNIWTFEDGILTANKDRMIWTKRDYDNFILDLEFKTGTNANSGVIVYCSNMQKWIPNSVEIQILDDYGKKWKKVPDTWRCGGIFGHLAPSKQMVKHPGQWNRMTITCKGQMIEVVLNGKEVAAMDMSKWTSSKKNPGGTSIPGWLSKPLEDLPTKGRIGLQGKHGGAPIWFRNIRIKQSEKGS